MLDPLCAIAATVKADLPTRVHNLPPELFAMIHDYTFALDNTSSSPLNIDSSHKIPSIMQVDTTTRSELASELYTPEKPIYLPNHELAAQWLLSLPAEHRALLKEVRVGNALPEVAQMLDSSNYLAKMQWGYIMRELRSEGKEIGDGVLKFRVSAPVHQGAEKKDGETRRQRIWRSEID